ncbi:MAG: hypothetical protein JW940_16670 [Polyangiaceae bacterium]|nr:hypothetical protein [Polyangiaceae bacterium]
MKERLLDIGSGGDFEALVFLYIARVARADATRGHRPAVMRMGVSRSGWTRTDIELPCTPYDEVFHGVAPGEDVDEPESYFVAGLRELESIRTAGGAALRDFLHHNLGQFEPPVQQAIRALAEEVLEHD